jgi:DmsE family decaheme c-type cytochrome
MTWKLRAGRCSGAAIAMSLLALLWAGGIAGAAAQGPQTSREGIVLPAAGSAPPRQPAGAPPRTAPPQAAGQDGFVGETTCLECHEDRSQGYTNTIHGRRDHPRSPAATQGCESCHGPGAKHAESGDPALIRVFSRVPAREVSETCMTCHARGQHAVWDGSAHDARNLSCATCHSVHAFKSERAQLKTVREMDTCATCHRDKVAKVDRSGHMPVREGKMECSTCHNPHGSTSVRQLRIGDSVGDLCTSCHADKRGPYLWEHAPTRDGCATCHDPHGSPNERMLTTKTPILCQRCHVMTRHPSTIYDSALIGSGATPSARIFARSCVTCHSTIHGSNHPSGQRFIR